LKDNYKFRGRCWFGAILSDTVKLAAPANPLIGAKIRTTDGDENV